MKGLDTNILVRYLTQDDASQWQKATDYLEAIASDDETCFISHMVLCETIWVLKSAYGYNKSQSTTILKKLLSTRLFEFEDRVACWTLYSNISRVVQIFLIT